MGWQIFLVAAIPILFGSGFLVAGAHTKSASKNWEQGQGVITLSKFGFAFRQGPRFRLHGDSTTGSLFTILGWTALVLGVLTPIVPLALMTILN